MKTIGNRTWPERPRRSRHATLGVRQTWTRADGLAKVERFSDGSRQYVCFVRQSIDGDYQPLYGGGFLKLRDAQRACGRFEAGDQRPEKNNLQKIRIKKLRRRVGF